MDYSHTPSQEAAQHIAPSVGELQKLTLREIAKHQSGLTADEVAARLGLDRLSIRPRCTELRKKNQIFDSNVRRKNQSGRSATVWICKVQTDLFDQATSA